MNRTKTIRAVAFGLLLLLGLPRFLFATITEDWDSLPLGGAPTAAGVPYSLGDGWTAMASEGYETQGTYYSVLDNARYVIEADSGTNYVAQTEGENTRDDNTISMLVLSPFFQVDGSGQPIQMRVSGGSNGSTAPICIAGIGDTLAATFSGWQGMLLLDSSGNVLQSTQRTGDNNNWQLLQFDTTSLSTSATYQIAMVDTYSGGWGWIGLDTVNIAGIVAVPEPSSLLLCGLGTIWAMVLARARRVAANSKSASAFSKAIS